MPVRTDEVRLKEAIHSYSAIAGNVFPKHPRYSELSERIRSYRGGNLSRSSEHLAVAGFFYVG